MQETTQKSAETIGESFKSIFARMSDIKADKLQLIDDDGTTELLSDVELTLKNVGIDLRATINEYNSYEDVLSNLAAKWDTLTQVQQNALAKAFAGTRQRENFLVLMENYGKAMEYAATAADSAGTAQEKFNAYLDSVEAHYNTLIASAEALSRQTIPADLINGLLDAGSAILDFLEYTNLLTIALSSLGAALAVKGLSAFGSKIKSLYSNVVNLSAAFDILGKSANTKLNADQFKELQAVTKNLTAQQLKLIVSNKNLTNEQRMALLTATGLTEEEAAQTLATMGLATAEGGATTATFSLSGAFKALGAAIAANPIGFIAVALTTIISVIGTVNQKIKESRQELIDAGNEAAESANNLIELANTYLDLADAVDAGTASKEDMIAAKGELLEALGAEGDSIDDLIAKYGNLKSAIIEATREGMATDISVALSGANAAMDDAIDELETWLGTSISTGGGADIYKYLQEQGFSGVSAGTGGGTISLPNADYWDAFSNPSIEQLLENRKYLEDTMNAVRDKFGADNDVFKQLSEAYQRYSDALDPVVEAIDNANNLIAQDLVLAQRAISDPTTQDEFDEFRKNIIEALENDMDFNANGSFSAANLVDNILAANSAYSQFLADSNSALDQVADNTAAAEEEILSKSEKLKQTLSELWASEDFEDTKKSILEMATTLDGITGDNISDLVSKSGELAALLDQDGMSAQFLANVLQTEAMGGDGFALITEDALALNEALEGLKGQFADVTDAKARYDAAMKVAEKDTNFKSYAEAFKELNEQFVAGTTNSNAFWAAAEFLFGADQLNAWGWSDGLDEIYNAMQRNVEIFKDADSAGAGFLDRLYELSEAGEIKADDGSVIGQIEKLSDGSYDFQFDTENLDALADKLGITSEAAEACMQALSMYGDFQFYDVQTVMDTIKEIGLASDSINGTAVNVGTLTDQLISLGYTNKEIYDLLNVLQEVDGITLLNADANIDTLTQSLTDLGLAAQDGVEVTVNADGLSDLMSQLNFTKEDTQNLITKLGEADGITLTNAEGEVIDLNTALEHTDELSFASVTSELDEITDSADLAQQAVADLQYSINTLKGKTVTVTVDMQRKNSILGSIFGFAKGTNDAPEGEALVGEEGAELIKSGDKAYLAGVDGPEIVNLEKGDTVYTADQTKKIYGQNAKVFHAVVPAYAGGRFNTGGGKPSVLPTTTSGGKSGSSSSGSKSSTNSSKSTTTEKAESEFERLYKYHQHLLAMEQENTEDYLAWLDGAYQDAYKKGEIELDDYYKYEEEVFEKRKALLDDQRKEYENAITLTENWLDQAIANNDHAEIYKYTSEIVDYYRKMQDELHKEAEFYRSLGYSDTSDEVSKLSDMWWDYYDKIKSVSAEAWQQVVDNANEAVDEITGLYDTLKGAAEEYAESGFITVDTLQEICGWGLQYLAYLQDENGQLVINEESIQNVIAARTQQMAVETALNYIQQLREALTNNDTVALMNLTTATEAAADSTWDLVYAQLQLLGLNSEQYDNALTRINTLRSLTDLTVSGIGKVEGAITKANEAAKEALEDQADALDDLLKYVEEMIKTEVENQIQAIEDQVDAMQEIVDLQKKSLDLEREKDKYSKDLKDKLQQQADLQKQITMLDLDDSRDAAAQKAKLQEELAEVSEDITELQNDKAYDSTVDMLDELFDSYEREKNKEIDVLEDSISSEEKLYRLALQRIEEQGQNLINQLLDWNYQYGEVTNSTIQECWDNASAAIQQYHGYLEAVLATQRELASIEVNSSYSGGGSIGGGVIGQSGSYDTSGGSALIQHVADIVQQMRDLGKKWSGTSDPDKRAQYHEEAAKLAAKLPQYGVTAQFEGSSGIWYIVKDKLNPNNVGKILQNCYHSGGFVGDPSLKQDEEWAKLQKGELVVTEEQQKPMFETLDFADTMLGKYGKVLGEISGTDILSQKMASEIKQDGQVAQDAVENMNIVLNNTVNIPVQALQKLDDAEIRQLTKKIGDKTIDRINDSFYKRGKVKNKMLLRPHD